MDSNQRAARARQLREDAIFREVMDGLREDAITVWRQTKIDDNSQREFSWLMVRVIDNIEARLQSIVDEQIISSRASVRAPE